MYLTFVPSISYRTSTCVCLLMVCRLSTTCWATPSHMSISTHPRSARWRSSARWTPTINDGVLTKEFTQGGMNDQCLYQMLTADAEGPNSSGQHAISVPVHALMWRSFSTLGTVGSGKRECSLWFWPVIIEWEWVDWVESLKLTLSEGHCVVRGTHSSDDTKYQLFPLPLWKSAV